MEDNTITQASPIDRCRDIERSIIKRFRKEIWRPFVKALNEYDMIKEGDNIAVCISGGKDSMLLAKCMQEILRHGKDVYKRQWSFFGFRYFICTDFSLWL